MPLISSGAAQLSATGSSNPGPATRTTSATACRMTASPRRGMSPAARAIGRETPGIPATRPGMLPPDEGLDPDDGPGWEASICGW